MKPRQSDPLRSLVHAPSCLPVLEELELRLETQMFDASPCLDQEDCIYYLCTTRCSDTKCSGFGEPHTESAPDR